VMSPAGCATRVRQALAPTDSNRMLLEPPCSAGRGTRLVLLHTPLSGGNERRENKTLHARDSNTFRSAGWRLRVACACILTYVASTRVSWTGSGCRLERPHIQRLFEYRVLLCNREPFPTARLKNFANFRIMTSNTVPPRAFNEVRQGRKGPPGDAFATRELPRRPVCCVARLVTASCPNRRCSRGPSGSLA
jgi:hypothetical protein